MGRLETLFRVQPRVFRVRPREGRKGGSRRGWPQADANGRCCPPAWASGDAWVGRQRVDGAGAEDGRRLQLWGSFHSLRWCSAWRATARARVGRGHSVDAPTAAIPHRWRPGIVAGLEGRRASSAIGWRRRQGRRRRRCEASTAGHRRPRLAKRYLLLHCLDICSGDGCCCCCC